MTSIEDRDSGETNEKIITHSTNEVQLHSTKDVLWDHLCAKIREVLPSVDAPNLSTKILKTYSYSYVVRMLQDKTFLCAEVQGIKRQNHDGQLLKNRYVAESSQEMETVSQDKIRIGEDLFQRVAEIDTELCAQITGMLLEMDGKSLMKLLTDEEKLEAAVSRAKIKYLSKHYPTTLPSKEDMGEEVYEAVHKCFPEYASKITGMLLELDTATLQQLLDNPSLLHTKAEAALRTLKDLPS